MLCVSFCGRHWRQIPLHRVPGQGSGSPSTLFFGGSRKVVIPETGVVNAQGLLTRSPESLRRLTQCNCDCEILTASGLRRYSVECIHPSQRCVTQRIMTDNIFEIKLNPLPSPCAPAIQKTLESCSLTSLAPALHGVGTGWLHPIAATHFFVEFSVTPPLMLSDVGTVLQGSSASG